MLEFKLSDCCEMRVFVLVHRTVSRLRQHPRSGSPRFIQQGSTRFRSSRDSSFPILLTRINGRFSLGPGKMHLTSSQRDSMGRWHFLQVDVVDIMIRFLQEISSNELSFSSTTSLPLFMELQCPRTSPLLFLPFWKLLYVQVSSSTASCMAG